MHPNTARLWQRGLNPRLTARRVLGFASEEPHRFTRWFGYSTLLSPRFARMDSLVSLWVWDLSEGHIMQLMNLNFSKFRLLLRDFGPKVCSTNNFSKSMLLEAGALIIWSNILSPICPEALFECTLLQQHICYMLLEHCAFKYALEHIWLTILLHIVYAPGAYCSNTVSQYWRNTNIITFILILSNETKTWYYYQ